MTSHTEELRGTIEKIIFQSPESGFMVFLLKHGAHHTTVKGFMPAVQAGQEVKLSGIWGFHPKFGKQFDAQKCIAQVPTSITGLKKFLASGLIKGIGPSYADKLVDAFGASVLEVIEEHPERLELVPGIGPKRAELIIAGYKEQKEVSSIMVYLQDKNISAAYAAKIYKRYGAESIAVLEQNPYRLAEDIWGIGFKLADTIAQNMGVGKTSINRIKAGILHAISTAVQFGHLYVQVDELKAKTTELLELEEIEPLLKQSLHQLYDDDKIKLLTVENKHYVTLSAYYGAEKGVATRIRGLLSQQITTPFDIQALYEQLRTQQQGAIALNEDQQRGILTCLQHKVTVITGGPGTGKTTLIKELLRLLDEKHIRYKLAAPTGRAAKRIIEGTGRTALTIHRLLEFEPMTMSFQHNEYKPLELDFLIIDESSMIDIFIAHSLLKALPVHAQILFIGDIDQLPSVGAGNFLHDLIASQVVPCVRLHEIFRQAADSMIVINAHKVNKGEFPTTAPQGGKHDFYYRSEQVPEKVPDHLADIYGSTLKRFGIRHDQAIVLVPMNKGSVGTQYLNTVVQKLVNPHETTGISYHGTHFKINDQVMQLRNNYDKHVYNGDIGTIADCNTEDKQLLVRFGDKTIEYRYEELDELVLAYAVSIHKSQGSEYNAVIVPLFMQHFTLLQRNLVYTALTRAKKLCIFIGQPKALAMAIKNNKATIRTTFLQQYLTTELACR